MGESPDTHGRLPGDNFGPLQPAPGLLMKATLKVNGRKTAFPCLGGFGKWVSDAWHLAAGGGLPALPITGGCRQLGTGLAAT
jgi:hypothetical protein